MDNRIVLGMSGGVDSSLSARLLMEAGFDVRCLFLSYNGADPSPARRACRELGLPLTVCDITAELERHVIAPFIEGYLRGLTPNPCILCNPKVKFNALVAMADRLGAAYVATGHYARVRDGRLYASKSPKDQSYMLYRLTPEVIARCIFPLGDMEDKAQVRRLAGEAGLSSSAAGDSMEICFIPSGDHGRFIRSRGFEGKRGNFVDEDGNVLAPHEGIHRYTVGQRRGLGVAASGRLYVKSIDPKSGDIVLSLSDPKGSRVNITDITFACPEYSCREGFECLVKLRHSRGFSRGRCYPQAKYIQLDSPARAPSPGQSAVCYGGDGLVICGGFITG